MRTLIVGLIIGLVIVWGAAFIERIESIITGKREPSPWSLLFVGFMLLVHVVLIYAEGSVIGYR